MTQNNEQQIDTVEQEVAARYDRPRMPELESTIPPVELALQQFSLNAPIEFVEKDPTIRGGNSGNKWFDQDRGWQYDAPVAPYVRWSSRDADGTIQLPIAITSVDLLYGSDGYGPKQRYEADELLATGYKPVALELGVSLEELATAQEWGRTYAEQRQAINTAEQERFWQEFTRSQAFGHLPIREKQSIGSMRDDTSKYSNDAMTELVERAYTLLEQADNGDIVTNFGGWERQGGDNTMLHWVIGLDGVLRASDSSQHHRSNGSTGRGTSQYWDVVDKREIAITWSVLNKSSPQVFEVAMGDKVTITQQQLEAVRAIENDISVRQGSFGLDEEAEQADRPLDDALTRAVRGLPSYVEEAFLDEPSLTNILSRNGIQVYGDHDMPTWFDLSWDEANELDNKLASVDELPTGVDVETDVIYQRQARRVYSERVRDGLLELYIYKKWGGWNLNLRWREIEGWEADDNEQPEPLETSEVDEEDTQGEVSDMALQALMNRFNS